MGLTKFPNGVSSFGVPILGGGSIVTTGSIFFVDSVTGSNSNSGSDPDNPVATIDHAVNLCTANKGDYILVMPNHVETLSDTTDCDVDVAGVTVLGLGSGDNMPRVNYPSTGSIFSVGANNITLANLNFHASIPDCVVGVDIEDASDFTRILGCRFDVETTTTDEFLISINNNNDANNTLIKDVYINMGLGDAVHGILFTADSDNSAVIKCHIEGDFTTANIGGITTLSQNLLIEDNLLISGGSGGIGTVPVLVIYTGTTGVVRGNMFLGNLATAAAYATADAMWFGDNQYGDEVGGANCTTSASDGTVALGTITQHSDG